MRVSVRRIALIAFGILATAGAVFYGSLPAMKFQLWIFDWQAAGTIATLTAVAVALWVGLEPARRSERERVHRARTLALLLSGEIEKNYLIARGILQACEQNAGREFAIHQARAITIYYANLNVSTLAELAERIHDFDELLAGYVAQALSNIQTVKSLVAPFGLELAMAATKPILAEDVREGAEPLAKSLALARTGLYRLLGQREDEEQLLKSVEIVSGQITGRRL